MMTKILTLASLALALVLSACVEQTTATYVRPSTRLVDQAYVKPGVDFSRYTKLMPAGLDIYYPESDVPPPEQDVARIRASFTDAFREAVAGSYPVVNQPGPDVLKVRAQVIDMKILGSDGSFTPTGRLQKVVTRGELTLLMEIMDSQTGEVLARAGDRTTDMSAEPGAVEWQEVEQAAQHWARLFRDWLDRSLGRPAGSKK